MDDQVVAVGSALVLRLRATDVPTPTRSRYGFAADAPDIASRATLSRTPSGDGTFRWRPVAADVGLSHFDFTASDGDATPRCLAGRDRGPLRHRRRDRAGLPRAARQAGTTLDLAGRDCLDLAILVQDQDSVAVTKAQEVPVIEGATLDQTGPFAASWRWCRPGPRSTPRIATP
ncbi:MAG: hypothetical protein HS111_21645 [Kofleriaceae bacterium]|nr:hypothetical protein [Kofleriaceae bacterium]